MQRIFLLSLLLLVSMGSCRKQAASSTLPPPVLPEKLSFSEHPQISNWFAEQNLQGSFTVLPFSESSFMVNDSLRSDIGRLPASTFKIFNSLVILEEGVAEVRDTLSWDGVVRGWKKWDRSQTMDSAMRYSAVWYYQEMARRVGRERMEYWLEGEEYGNTATGPEIDMFWLNGDIRISPREQVLFLRKLGRKDLGFRQETQSEVLRIMEREAPSGYQVRSKTGWAVTDSLSYCWNVGLVYSPKDTFAYALEFDLLEEGQEKWRNEGHLEILSLLGILPESLP